MGELRICVDARIAPGLQGGVEQVIIGLASALSRLNDGDERYYFLVGNDAADWIRPYLAGPCQVLTSSPANHQPGWIKLAYALLPQAQRLWYRLSPLLGPRTVRLPKSDGTIENAGIDVMHFTFQQAFLTDVPSIYHPHDLQHLHLPQYFSPRARLAREVTYRAFCERAELVAVGSNWIKEDLVGHYALPEEKVQVIPLAPVLTAYSSPTSDEVLATRRRLSIPSTFVFYPAQTWPHKNHLGLLEALSILREQYGLRVPLVCSGLRNSFYPAIERRVRELGLDAQVMFVGFVTPSELQCLYKMAHCVVIPTKFEAGSFPLWEAFLTGVPAACSNVTSLPEQAGDAALLFDPNDSAQMAEAINRLWTDEPLRRELIQRGTERVSGFTWERTARIFRAHYRRIAGRELTDEDRYLMSGSDPRLPRSSAISPMEN